MTDRKADRLRRRFLRRHRRGVVGVGRNFGPHDRLIWNARLRWRRLVTAVRIRLGIY